MRLSYIISARFNILLINIASSMIEEGNGKYNIKLPEVGRLVGRKIDGY